MSNSRSQTWLAVGVLVVGLFMAVMLGLWGYVNATATPWHPDVREIPSVSEAVPEKWAGAVERARQVVRAGLAGQNLPGLSVAVGLEDDVVWAEGLGWANLENRIPVAPDMRFRIGTASKALTSAAVGRLVEQRRLNLDDKIQTYVPEFREKPWPVTLRHLMSHVAGIRNDSGDEGPLLSERCERPVDALPRFARASILFEPGTQYRYSSYGWILVSAAVEAAAGEPFLRFMRNEIFQPLGMHDTMADSTSEEIPNRVTPYFPRVAADPTYGLHLMREINYSCYAGASVFLSTPSDLERFGLAMANGRLLEPSTVALLQTPQRLTSGAETGYGLGWDLEDVTLAGEPARWVGHEGTSLGGMVASLMTFPDRGLVVAVTANISYADTERLALDVAQAFAESAGARAAP